MLTALRTRKARGFTLIELLIVLIILGVLAAVVAVSVSGVNENGTVAACKADKSALESAQEIHFAKIGSFAADDAALVSANLIREESDMYEVEPDGDVTVEDADCTGI